MAYNTQLYAFERMRFVLDQIIAQQALGKPLWFDDVDQPHSFAYRIREAIRAAQANNVEPYASLNVSVRPKGERVRVLYLRTPRPIAQVDSKHATEIVSEFDAVVFLLKARPDRYTFPNFTGRVAAVDQWCVSSKQWRIVKPSPLVVEGIKRK